MPVLDVSLWCVKTGRAGRDAVTRKQLGGAPRVFGGDDRNFAQHPQGPAGDVFEVADGRGDHEQRAGHDRGVFIVPLTDRDSGSAIPGARFLL